MDGSRDNLPLGLFPLGLRVLDAFFTLLRRRSWRRVPLCRFCTLIRIVSETATVSLWTLPVSFPLLFYPIIVDHGVSFRISVSGLKILHSNSARYFFFPLSSMCDNQVQLLMNLHIVQFQYGLWFLRLSYSSFVQAFQDVIRWDLCHR